MTSENPRLRLILFVASSACGWTIAGCVRERHVVGEARPDARVAFPDGATGGTGPASDGAPAATLDGGTDGGAGGADGNATAPDAPPGGATVVSLGDKASAGWSIAITPEEVARRLSQLLLRKPPSTALTAAVVASSPKTNQDVGQLTEGLLLQESSLAGRQAFYRWWLGLDALTTITRDPALFPAFTTDVRVALVDQTLTFVEDVTWRPQGDLSTLLTEPAVFVTTATAPWFPGAVVPAGPTATRIVLDATQYAGIVTQPAVVATADSPTRANPSARGMAVRTRYFCQAIPSEPPGLISKPPFPAGMTLRQWLEGAVKPPVCSACHTLFDPPGMAFGHFDAVGAFHDTEGGLPVDTTGLLRSNSTGSELAFSGAPGLANHLAQLPEVKTCFATKWLAFATGAFPLGDTVHVSSNPAPFAVDADYVVRRATIQGRLNLRGTIRAVTETHTFLDP